MKRLGKVLHVSSSGNLIVKASTVPEIGSDVVDEALRKIGFVYDVIGPVGSPYVAVKPLEGIDLSNYAGKSLYILRENKGRHKKPKKRR